MTVPPSPAPQPWTRRLSDKLRLAFHTARDEADLWIAERLLNQMCKRTRSPSVLANGLGRCKRENLSRVTGSAAGELALHVLGAVAHFEQRLTAEGSKDGIALKLSQAGLSLTTAARQVGLGRAIVYRKMAHVSVSRLA